MSSGEYEQVISPGYVQSSHIAGVIGYTNAQFCDTIKPCSKVVVPIYSILLTSSV